MDIYDWYFSICLGLFIGGIIMSVISFILAEMSSTDHDSVDHMDHIDHLDHIDHPDHIDHIDHVDHIDHIDHPDHIDHIDHVDHLDNFDHPDHIDHVDHIDHPDHVDHHDHIDSHEEITPAPFMLLFSSWLLIFGISGMASYYIFIDVLQFLMFIIAPLAGFAATKVISIVWKKIAKSSHYTIASTQNLIGKEGIVTLKVDKYGGIIKLPSDTPMKFEKQHVKPVNPEDIFTKGEKVYIVGVKNEILLVDNDLKKFNKKKVNF